MRGTANGRRETRRTLVSFAPVDIIRFTTHHPMDNDKHKNRMSDEDRHDGVNKDEGNRATTATEDGAKTDKI